MTSLGFSPCPNDTFIFYALANSKLDMRGFDFSLCIEDVETLNQLAVRKIVDVTKISCHAYFFLKNDYQFLGAGGAFGRGCGPLLVTRGQQSSCNLRHIAIPGELTTAFLLLKLYLSSEYGMSSGDFSFLTPDFPGNSGRGEKKTGPQFIVMPFNEIMRSVSSGRVDAGLIIHESRFTYPEYGLQSVVDLGEWWETKTDLPIPLGGIIARRSLGKSRIQDLEALIRESVKYSTEHREEVMPYIKKYSQEMSESVIIKHIELYVNNYTVDMGADGMAALDRLLALAAGI